MVRTALKNGAVFELPYTGALGAEGDAAGALVGGSEGGSGAKRNWWAAAREIVRVTKGKGIIVTGGVMNQGDLRAPKDIGNLYVRPRFAFATKLTEDSESLYSVCRRTLRTMRLLKHRSR